MQIRSVGIDLGKTTFHLVALGDNGKVLLKKKFTQKQLITFTANLQSSLTGRLRRQLARTDRQRRAEVPRRIERKGPARRRGRLANGRRRGQSG